MTAYYNEIDPFAAEWLRQLIKAGHIVPGDVDTRSIEDVTPNDLGPYTQCHFFAGIGVWSYALRCAGWPDDKPVWTGSCPCQPFSSAGKGGGIDDERHLWPALLWHIQQQRPPVVFGEQVASRDGLGWWDVVSADLEGTGYACGAVNLCAAGVGAPHIRQRLFWVADAQGQRSGSRQSKHRRGKKRVPTGKFSESICDSTGSLDELGNPQGIGLQRSPAKNQTATDWGKSRGGFSRTSGSFWSDAEWLPCKDGKARPAKPGAFPLVDGIASDLVCGGDHGPSAAKAIQTESTAEARAMRLKGYGNAIVGPLATEFILAYSTP